MEEDVSNRVMVGRRRASKRADERVKRARRVPKRAANTLNVG